MTSPAFAKGAGIKVGGNVNINATEGGVVTALAIEDSHAKNANGSMIGPVEVGGNVNITATRKKVTTALAIQELPRLQLQRHDGWGRVTMIVAAGGVRTIGSHET